MNRPNTNDLSRILVSPDLFDPQDAKHRLQWLAEEILNHLYTTQDIARVREMAKEALDRCAKGKRSLNHY